MAAADPAVLAAPVVQAVSVAMLDVAVLVGSPEWVEAEGLAVRQVTVVRVALVVPGGDEDRVALPELAELGELAVLEDRAVLEEPGDRAVSVVSLAQGRRRELSAVVDAGGLEEQVLEDPVVKAAWVAQEEWVEPETAERHQERLEWTVTTVKTAKTVTTELLAVTAETGESDLPPEELAKTEELGLPETRVGTGLTEKVQLPTVKKELMESEERREPMELMAGVEMTRSTETTELRDSTGKLVRQEPSMALQEKQAREAELGLRVGLVPPVVLEMAELESGESATQLSSTMD